MVHPLLTAFFDLMLIGTALMVIATMVAEHLASREPAVGRPRRVVTPVARPVARPHAAWHTPPAVTAPRSASQSPLSRRAA